MTDQLSVKQIVQKKAETMSAKKTLRGNLSISPWLEQTPNVELLFMLCPSSVLATEPRGWAAKQLETRTTIWRPLEAS